MPLNKLINAGVFEPKQIAAMTVAYERVLQRLGLPDRNSPLAEVAAKKIIELAKLGELNPEVLCEKALVDLEPDRSRQWLD